MLTQVLTACEAPEEDMWPSEVVNVPSNKSDSNCVVVNVSDSWFDDESELMFLTLELDVAAQVGECYCSLIIFSPLKDDIWCLNESYMKILRILRQKTSGSGKPIVQWPVFSSALTFRVRAEGRGLVCSTYVNHRVSTLRIAPLINSVSCLCTGTDERQTCRSWNNTRSKKRLTLTI